VVRTFDAVQADRTGRVYMGNSREAVRIELSSLSMSPASESGRWTW
jgi:hypothetical protein